MRNNNDGRRKYHYRQLQEGPKSGNTKVTKIRCHLQIKWLTIFNNEYIRKKKLGHEFIQFQAQLLWNVLLWHE